MRIYPITSLMIVCSTVKAIQVKEEDLAAPGNISVRVTSGQNFYEPERVLSFLNDWNTNID